MLTDLPKKKTPKNPPTFKIPNANLQTLPRTTKSKQKKKHTAEFLNSFH